MTLPNFIIIGAMKSGTTSLHHYLGQHPAVFVSARKAPNYFAANDLISQVRPGYLAEWDATKTLKAYRDYFASVGDEHLAWGEATTRYLWHPKAPQHIYQLIPSVRLIAILRDPVDRAHSHYLMNRRRGLEAERDFETAFHLSDSRIARGWDPFVYGYKEVSQYGVQLKRFLDLFPREQIQIDFFAELKNAPHELMVRLFRFLGVDPQFTIDFSRYYNPGFVPREGLEWLTSWDSLIHRMLYSDTSGVKRLVRTTMRTFVPKRLHGSIGTRLLFRKKPPLSQAVRDGLRSHFREDLQLLQEILKRDVDF